MALLEFNGVGFGYGELQILDGVSGALHAGNVVGLVGANGGGKTTLLRLLTGQLAPQTGKVQRQRGLHLSLVGQAVGGSDDEALHDHVRAGRADLLALEAQIAQLSAELAQRTDDAALLARLGEAQARFAALGGHRWDSEVDRLLGGLSFAPAEFAAPLGSLSGGQRQKAALARALLSDAQQLIFDEPTNHLDLAAQEFFARYVAALAGRRSADSVAALGQRSVLLVSHDRWLLQRLCTHIWELEDGSLYRYTGGWASFLPQRQARREQAQQAFARQQEHIARTEEYIRRNIAGQNTKQARGRRTHLARMERLERPADDPQLAFVLRPAVPTGEQVLVVEDLAFAYDGGLEPTADAEVFTHVAAGPAGLALNPPLDVARAAAAAPDKTLLTGLSFTLYRGERLAIVGPNGCGKTTLLKLLTRRLAPQRGLIAWGSNAELGVFSQDSADLTAGRTLIAELREVEPMISDGDARSYLARFGFSGDDVLKDVGSLSGGERSRLSLAKIFRRRPNVLILDEPTNHLDVFAREALEQFLAAYEGTLVMVTHDRALLARLCRRLVVFERRAAPEPGFEVSFFRGDYEQYASWRELQSEESTASSGASAALALPDGAQPADAPADALIPGLELSYAQLAEQARTQRTSVEAYCKKQAAREEQRAEVVESRIAALESSAAALTAAQAEAATDGRYGEIARLQQELDAASLELAQRFDELDGIHQLIEAWLAASE